MLSWIENELKYDGNSSFSIRDNNLLSTTTIVAKWIVGNRSEKKNTIELNTQLLVTTCYKLKKIVQRRKGIK